MGICSPCAICEDIFQCLNAVRVGKVEENGSYLIKIHDLSTDRLNHKTQNISDFETRFIECDPEYFAMNHTYRISLTLEDENVDVIVKDGIDTALATCVEFTMRKSHGDVPNIQILQIKYDD